MRILIFGINYAPELTGIGPYTTGLADHFAKEGHRVEVVTGVPHYPEWRRMPNVALGLRNPNVRRSWHHIPRRPGAIGRMLYEVTWLLTALPRAVTTHAEVVIGVVPSLSGGLLALVAARRNKAPLALIVQDLMASAAAQSGYRGGTRVAGITGLVENFLLRRCDRIGVVSEAFRARLVESGVSNAKIHSVRNWTRACEPSESFLECRRRLGWIPGEFVCLHAGNMGRKQGLDNLLELAPLLARQRVRIVLAGDGNDRPRLQALAQSRNLTNLSFVGVQRPGQFEAMLSAADVLLISQRPSVGDMSMPSKLTAYFTAGRPVAAAVAPACATAKELERAGAGIVVPAGNSSALAAAICRLKDPSLAAEFGRRGREYAQRFLTQDAALAGYSDFLEQVAHGSVAVEEHSTLRAST